MPRIGRYTGGGDTDLGVIAPGTIRVFILNVMPENGWGTIIGWRGGRNGASNSAAQGVVYWAPNQQPTTRLANTDVQVMSTVMTSGSEGATYTKAIIETTQAYSPIDSALKMPKNRRHAIGLFVPPGYGTAGHGMIQQNIMNPQPDSAYFYDDQGVTTIPEEFDIDQSQVAGWMTCWIEYVANRKPTCTVDTPSGNTATPLLSGDFSDADEVYGDRITQYQFRVTRVSNSQVVWGQDWVNASASDQANDTFENTYSGSALVAGQTYKVEARVQDEFGEISNWSTAKTWIYSATGTVTMSGTISGKQSTLTPGPFGFRWSHAAGLSTNAVRIQILENNAVARQSGIIAKTVSSSSPPGTLSSISWAETGFSALTVGKVYSYRIEGRDTNGVWSGYATNPVTFTTNTPPGKPTAMAPQGGQIISVLPIQASFVMTDPDDSPGAGLTATLTYVRPDASTGNVNPAYNSSTGRWEYSLTGTIVNQPGLYTLTAKGSDATQTGPTSDPFQFYYLTGGGTVTITAPGSGATITTGTPTFTWSVGGVTQVSWRIFVFNSATQVLEYDTGYVFGTETSHQIPINLPLDEGAFQVYLEIVDTLGNTSAAGPQNFNVDLPSGTPIQSIQLSPYRGNMDPGTSGILIVWPQSSVGPGQFVQYVIERKAVNAEDDPDGRITIAKITEVAETTFIDYYFRDNVEYIYYIRQDYKVGTDTIRSGAITGQISARLRGMSVGSVSDPHGMRLGSRYWDQREISRVFNRTVQVPWGSSLPTVLADPTNYKRVRIRMRFVDDAQYQALDYMEMLNSLADSGDIVCYRDPKRRKLFGVITDFVETDEKGGIIGVSVELTQVNFREEVPFGVGM